MMRRLAAFIALASLPLLSGCVAALLPLAAVGVIGKNQIDEVKAKREFVAVGAVDLGTSVSSVTIDPTDSASVGDTDAFAGKGGGLDIPEVKIGDQAQDYFAKIFSATNRFRSSAFTDFTNFAVSQSARLEAGERLKSAVLEPRFDIAKPKTMSCAGKPLAVLIDLDDKDVADWASAQTFYRQTGLIDTIEKLRASKISVIWLSGQPVAASAKLAALLDEAGLVKAEASEFLFLDRGGEDRKQARRWEAARNYCIVAMAGDKRSDFDELYDYLRNPDGAIALENMFGQGWFITPPPFVAQLDDPEAPEAISAKPPTEDEG